MKRSSLLLIAFAFVLCLQSFAQVKPTETIIPDSANKTDQAGNKTGYWIEKSGDLTYSGYYKENKKVDQWIGRFSSNVVGKVEFYRNGLLEGTSIQLDKKGKLTHVEEYKNGLPDGKTIYFGQNAEKPVSETEYSKGMKNGLFRQYYDNGKIQEETWYAADKKDGLSRWNNKSGQRVAEYSYKNGVFDGIQKTYYENDTLQSINTYTNNVLNGDWMEYYRNGQLKISGKYLNGEKEGAWIEYDELGKAIKNTRFKAGQELKKK